MGSKLQSLSDAEFKNVLDSRFSAALMLALPSTGFISVMAFVDLPWILSFVQAASAVIFVLVPAAYWFWLEPLLIEERRRSENKST
jgi:heme A synthase